MEKISSGKSSERVYITKNSRETQHLAEDFSQRFSQRLILDKGSTLTHAKVLALYGELGSGKTTFVQGLAKGLGIKQRIISPTFVLVRQYKVSPARCNTFYHIDLYRIENEREVQGLGLEEIIGDPQNIVVIEWAERVRELLPKDRIDIRFEYINENERKITIKKISNTSFAPPVILRSEATKDL